MIKTGEHYPCGPCPQGKWEFECRKCGAVLNSGNVVDEPCDEPSCEACQYCGTLRCPECGSHVHCGGCV